MRKNNKADFLKRLESHCPKVLIELLGREGGREGGREEGRPEGGVRELEGRKLGGGMKGVREEGGRGCRRE